MSRVFQREITTPGPLLKPDGTLNDCGWARQPILDCNLENAHFYQLRFMQWLRIKRWDYYAIFTPDHLFSFTIGDIGYLGSIFAYTIDFTSWKYHEETLTIQLGRGIILSRNSTSGESRFESRRVSLQFLAEPTCRRLKVRWDGFNGQDLNAEVTLTLAPQHESTVNVIPIGEKRFYYTRKVNCLPASGWILCNGKRHELDAARSLGCLDWGRGIWNYDSFWIWGSLNSFLPDGRTIGLNLGTGIGDMSAATDCSLILDGRVQKLGKVNYDYDSHNFMRSWRIWDEDGRLELTFTPKLERVAKTDFKLLFSEVHQMFGYYYGQAISDTGETIQLKDQLGFIEEHKAKW